jgi:hypothetical protein
VCADIGAELGDAALGQVEGEYGEGGPGDTYIIVRYDLGVLGEWFPRRTTVNLVPWSEAASVDASGHQLYHHFVSDWVTSDSWTTP